MASYRTQYEVRACLPDGRMLLAGHTARKSLSGILELVRRHGQDWARIAGTDRIAKVKGGMALGAIRYEFSGRTFLESQEAPLLYWKRAFGMEV